jgi:hypothetical protein
VVIPFTDASCWAMLDTHPLRLCYSVTCFILFHRIVINPGVLSIWGVCNGGPYGDHANLSSRSLLAPRVKAIHHSDSSAPTHSQFMDKMAWLEGLLHSKTRGSGRELLWTEEVW